MHPPWSASLERLSRKLVMHKTAWPRLPSQLAGIFHINWPLFQLEIIILQGQLSNLSAFSM